MCLHLEKEKPQLREMANCIVPRLASIWKRLGEQLNIKEYLLQNIEKDNPKDCEGCCSKMLSEWLDMTTDASWETILNATDKLSTDKNTDNG